MEQTKALSRSVEDQLIDVVRLVKPEQQLSWLQLCLKKDITANNLKKVELELQGFLNDFEKMDLPTLQAAIEKYDAKAKEVPDMRKSFTRYLDMIGEQLMVIEKRINGYVIKNEKWTVDEQHVLYKAKELFLKLREENEKKNDLIKNRTAEIAKLKIHVANEYARQLTQYKIDLNNTITNAYTQALNDELTEDGLKQYVTITEQAMREVKLSPLEKYAFAYHDKKNPDDVIILSKAIESVPDNNVNDTLASALKTMHDKFVLYFSDKANKEKALQFIKEQNAQNTTDLNEKLKTSQSLNVLTGIGNAIGELKPNDGIKPIKRKMEIVIQDDSQEFARNVMREFIARWQTCAPRLQVKKWGNLSIKQMAAALQEEDEMVGCFNYVEIKK